MATGIIRNVVNHAELTAATEALEALIDDVADVEAVDVSLDVPMLASGMERYTNSCYLHRFGRMVSLSVCFGVTASGGIAANTPIFGFPTGYAPSENVFCILGSAPNDTTAGVAIPMYTGLSNGAKVMLNQTVLPGGVFRGVVTYLMAEANS